VLVSDFDLSTGGTIVLFAKEDGTFKEVSRTSTQYATTDVDFNTAVLDAKEDPSLDLLGS
jgi:hypothetical protein